MLHMKFVSGVVGILLSVNLIKCSIDGITYMDPIKQRSDHRLYPRGEDPCNPLYWYPRNIPEYCNYRKYPIPEKAIPSLPMPIPVRHQNMFMPIPILSAVVPGLAPLPYSMPISPTYPVSPVASAIPSYPYPNPYENPQQSGMVPGLPGLVTKDGGINILPFSDAYSDLIENHKNMMIRRRLKELIEDYEDFPDVRNFRRLRKYARRNI